MATVSQNAQAVNTALEQALLAAGWEPEAPSGVAAWAQAIDRKTVTHSRCPCCGKRGRDFHTAPSAAADTAPAVCLLRDMAERFRPYRGGTLMSKSKKRSPAGLMSEAGKKSAKAVGDAAKQAIGKQPAPGSKSPTGNLTEAVKKAGRAVEDVARKVVGMQPTKVKKSGSE